MGGFQKSHGAPTIKHQSQIGKIMKIRGLSITRLVETLFDNMLICLYTHLLLKEPAFGSV